MNTMKKWVLAGLIGFSSVAVSMAAPTLTDDFNGNNGTITAAGLDYMNTWTPDVYTAAGIPANDGTRRTYVVSYEGAPNAYINPIPVESAYISYGAGGTITAYGHTLAGDYTSELGLAYWLGATAPEGGTTTFLTQYTGITLNVGAMNNLTGAYLSLDGMMIDLSSYANQTVTFNWNQAVWIDSNFSHGGDGALTSVITDFWTPGGVNYNPFADLSMYLVFYMGQNGSATINSFQLNGQEAGVPEPETVWMMLAVLASLGVTFRKQLMDLTGRFVKT